MKLFPVVFCNAWQGLKWIETWKSRANLFKCNACKLTKMLLRLVLPYKKLFDILFVLVTRWNVPFKGEKSGGTVWLLSGRGGISCDLDRKKVMFKLKKKIGKSKSHWITTLAQILQRKITGLLIYLNLGFSLSFLTKHCFHWGTPRFVLTNPLRKGLAFGFHTQKMNVVRVKGINYSFIGCVNPSTCTF